MQARTQRLAVISYASVRQVNRSVYHYLKEEMERLTLIVPSNIKLKSNDELRMEPPTSSDPEIVPMTLVGTNPRLYYFEELQGWLDQNKPTLILLENDPVSALGRQMISWCKRNNAKLICQTYENLKRDFLTTIKTKGFKSVPKNLAIQLLNYRMGSKVDGLFVVNRESEILFKNYGYRNIVRIPLGYDKHVFFEDNRLRELYRQKIGIERDEVLVAYFGRLIKEKGVDLLVKALAKLKNHNWKLLLDHLHDSESSFAIHVNDLIKQHGLENRVHYFDADHIEIANYMRAADVMVAPSITTSTFKEQYGRTVQEAMACGCVALVSDSGHLKDLVKDNRCIFAEQNVPALSERLSTMITNTTLRKEVSKTLKATAEKELTSEAQAHKIRETIEGF